VIQKAVHFIETDEIQVRNDDIARTKILAAKPLASSEEIIVRWGNDGRLESNIGDVTAFVDEVLDYEKERSQGWMHAMDLLGKSKNLQEVSTVSERACEMDEEERLQEQSKKRRKVLLARGKEKVLQTQIEKVGKEKVLHDQMEKVGKEKDLQDQIGQDEAIRECWPSNLIEIIKLVIEENQQAPETPEFAFEMSKEAAQRNFCVLSKYEKNLGKALYAQRKSPLGYGSEFRTPESLQKLFKMHPNWQRMKKILENGSDWPTDDLDDDSRATDLVEALEFTNHKGAIKNPDLLRKLCEKDVKYGYGLVLPLNKLLRLQGYLMAPMNIMRQNTIDECGRIIEKDRLTHDQSYVWGSGTSVNTRIDKSELLPCMFGHCIKRLVNWAVAARKKYPTRRILATKIDYKSAYRRCHLNWKTAIQTCTQLPEEDLAIVALRLTFGGAPGPYEWGVLSESICDLATAILHDDKWDPQNLHAPDPELVPKKKILDDSIPFGIGRDLIVDVPVDPRGMVEVYIDDTIGLVVDTENSGYDTRMERAILLAIYAAARPKHSDEPIPREEMAALAKLLAEAGLEEIKTILGWVFDFRRMIVSLPDNKFIAWSREIENLLEKMETTAKELEENIGRMVHLSMILPFVHHFMSRLRDLQARAKNRRSIKITAECEKDLNLMLFFLKEASKGVDLNQIAFRMPGFVYRSDSCPKGLGGYSHLGKAWRFYIPEWLQFRASNNLLEHIASIITPWIDILNGTVKKGDCILSLTDSSTSEGWAKKTNFSEEGEDPIQATIRIEVARGHAMRLLSVGIKDYSQWFPGKENDVSDALSRDDDRSNEELTNILRTFVPEQVPENFEIQPLPNEIVLWLTSVLQQLPVKEQLRERHTRTKLGRGGDGSNTSDPSELLRMSSSTDSAEDSASKSWAPLPWLCVAQDFRHQLMIPWLREQSEIPSRMWLRPSGKTTGPTRPRTKMESLDDFYHNSSELSKTQTQTRFNKKQSQSVS
jgi:hypothetical protein